MKILAIHPYNVLGDWNHRLQRQFKLMAEKCDLKVMGFYLSGEGQGMRPHQKLAVRDEIKKFKPDLLYINGFMAGHYVRDMHDKIVYDMGSYKSRNILMQDYDMSYDDFNMMTGEKIRNELQHSKRSNYFKMEDELISSVNAIIIWEGWEADLVRKVHPEANVHEISMMFYDTPKPIPFKDKKRDIMAVAAKWGKIHRNFELLVKTDKLLKGQIKIIGHDADATKFIEHGKLMRQMNKSRVIFCPYLSGGIGVICEALKMGCNVVLGKWHPFSQYVNQELIFAHDEEVIDKIWLAMDKYYPPARKLPTEKQQLTKIINLCQKVADN